MWGPGISLSDQEGQKMDCVSFEGGTYKIVTTSSLWWAPQQRSSCLPFHTMAVFIVEGYKGRICLSGLLPAKCTLACSLKMV